MTEREERGERRGRGGGDGQIKRMEDKEGTFGKR